MPSNERSRGRSGLVIGPTARRGLSLGFVAVILLVATGCGWIKRQAYADFGGRGDWQQEDRVVAALDLKAGERVADLGAGGGFFTFRLAQAVGPDGHVFAVDVDESMTSYIAAEAKDRDAPQVTTVLARTDDPELPEPVDMLFTCNTYHHIQDRVAYFGNVREKYLRPGALVAIIDYRPEETDHSTARDLIIEEMAAAGFALQAEHDWLERQSFLVFEVSS